MNLSSASDRPRGCAVWRSACDPRPGTPQWLSSVAEHRACRLKLAYGSANDITGRRARRRTSEAEFGLTWLQAREKD